MIFDKEEKILIDDFSLGEMQTAFLDKNGRVFYCGRKLYYRPRLFDIDYNKHKIKQFAATDKGVAVVTEENKLFYNGNFWKGKNKSENIETGIKEIDVEKVFENREIVQVGGSHETKFILLK